LVERRTENPGVGGSNPSLATTEKNWRRPLFEGAFLVGVTFIPRIDTKITFDLISLQLAFLAARVNRTLFNDFKVEGVIRNGP
jgi:hypothetical protein